MEVNTFFVCFSPSYAVNQLKLFLVESLKYRPNIDHFWELGKCPAHFEVTQGLMATVGDRGCTCHTTLVGIGGRM